MSLVPRDNRKVLAGILLALSMASLIFVALPARVSAAPSGAYFDHIVIIAMENTAYDSVFGSGTTSSCPTSSAPFLCSMLPLGSTLPNYNSYGATAADTNDFNGCSAACYVGFMAGDTYGVSDGYGSLSAANLVTDRMSLAGLTWQVYCESGCPRGNDHFPFTSFTDTSSSSNVFAGPSVSTSTFISAANSANPPNFLWYTPTDSDNMHDVSVSTGDSYLKNFLIGSGSIASPATGSLLASNVFTNPGYRTLLYLWWDECGGSNGSCDSNNAAPNLLYGTTVKKGYVSLDTTGIDEYAAVRTIENNWGFSPLAQGDTAAANAGYMFNDVFTSGGSSSSSLSASLTYSPSSTIATGTTVTFSASAQGGTGPYTYSWDFGDGNTATGASTTDTYATAGTYTVTLTTTDNNGQTSAKTQQVNVAQTSPSGQPQQQPDNQPGSGICALCSITGLFSGLSLLTVGLILGGASTATIFLARYHAQNRRLENMVHGRSVTTANVRYSTSPQSGRIVRNRRGSRSVQRKARPRDFDD